MKDVVRELKPLSLERSAEEWTGDLLNAIRESKRTGAPVPERFYKKYKQDDVLDQLKKMYGDGEFCYCCYCESIINIVSYERIEHRKPMRKTKDKYPEAAFEWDNLHLVCEICNNRKGKQYDETNPILDAALNNPISDHLGYCVDGLYGIYRETKSHKGVTTVKHANLDRPTLRRARLQVYVETKEAIDEIKRLGDDPRVHTKVRMLSDKRSGQFGSLIEWMLKESGIED